MSIQDIRNIPYVQFDKRNAEELDKLNLDNSIEPIGVSNLQQMNDMTREEIGISDKKIIVPSFNTTTKVFKRHF
jgi:hypothetical protein